MLYRGEAPGDVCWELRQQIALQSLPCLTAQAGFSWPAANSPSGRWLSEAKPEGLLRMFSHSAPSSQASYPSCRSALQPSPRPFRCSSSQMATRFAGLAIWKGHSPFFLCISLQRNTRKNTDPALQHRVPSPLGITHCGFVEDVILRVSGSVSAAAM